MSVDGEIEFPRKIPDVLKSSVHSLPAKWTMNVRRVAGDKHTSNAKLRGLAVVDLEVAAPVQGLRLETFGGPLAQYSLHHLERGSVTFLLVDHSHNTTASGTHRKNRYWPDFIRT